MILGDLAGIEGIDLFTSQKNDSGVVISSRARLARNLRNSAFPGWAGEDERINICQQLCSAFEKIRGLDQSVFRDMSKIDSVEKEILRERHLISNEFAEKGSGSFLVTSSDEHVAIMINEEDHLRLQAVASGLSMREVWKRVDGVDSELECFVDYAFSPEFGYLTACPSNLGTGLRISVMLHLPGLRLMDEVESVIKGLTRIDMEVRGLWGEGTEAFGNMFQISNRTTLGESEEAILSRMSDVVDDLVNHELNARGRLLEQRKRQLMDHTGRAFGILMHAQILTSVESVDLMSALRLGVELGFVRNLTIAEINEIMLLTQPGHLQKMKKKNIGPEERDGLRAEIVREKLRGISLA
ncbi:MAG: protein arginine kinase [Lentisphaerae bacterium RIFOXYA12_FULL_48_11]|nr:MAG: protein arginine kinase [Lentisphaerae bacterium RIFOXYA12_FULL_48_11]